MKAFPCSSTQRCRCPCSSLWQLRLHPHSDAQREKLANPRPPPPTSPSRFPFQCRICQFSSRYLTIFSPLSTSPLLNCVVVTSLPPSNFLFFLHLSLSSYISIASSPAPACSPASYFHLVNPPHTPSTAYLAVTPPHPVHLCEPLPETLGDGEEEPHFHAAGLAESLNSAAGFSPAAVMGRPPHPSPTRWSRTNETKMKHTGMKAVTEREILGERRETFRGGCEWRTR